MSTAVIACGAIANHIANIAEREDFDITVYPLPPLLHNRPEKIAAEVEAKFLEIKPKHQKVAIAYADCGTYGALDEIVAQYGLTRMRGSHCYDIFGGKERITKLTVSGTYFLTDYLVKSFHRSVVTELGLDRHPELRDDYFQHYSKVLWLAQNPTDELKLAAEQAANILQLPLEIEIVGESGLLDELKRLLDYI